MAWDDIPDTPANPDALHAVAAELDRLAGEFAGVGDAVAAGLRGGAEQFSAPVGPSILARATAHQSSSAALVERIAYGAAVLGAFAGDVMEYKLERAALLGQARALGPAPDPTTLAFHEYSAKLDTVKFAAAVLRSRFDGRIRLRARQLQQSLNGDHLSDLARAGEFERPVASQVFGAWSAPGIVVDGENMPALVRRWLDGETDAAESARAHDWVVQFTQWQGQLRENGRWMYTQDVRDTNRYERALYDAGVNTSALATVVAARKVEISPGSGFSRDLLAGRDSGKEPTSNGPRAPLGIGINAEAGPPPTWDALWARELDDENYIHVGFYEGSRKGSVGMNTEQVGAAGEVAGGIGVIRGAFRDYEYSILVGTGGLKGLAGWTEEHGAGLIGTSRLGLDGLTVSKDFTHQEGAVTTTTTVDGGLRAGVESTGGVLWKDGFKIERPDVDIKSKWIEVDTNVDIDLNKLSDRSTGSGGGSF
jgi:hypothetical protein